MRTVFAVALCFVLGGCATFGGGGPDPFGIYDIESIVFLGMPGYFGTAVGSVDTGLTGWLELRADGTGTWRGPEGSEPETAEFSFTLGDLDDGCFPFLMKSDDWEEGVGTICGDVLTITGDGEAVFHKRR